MTRYIFITGGVVSSLGKGLGAAALGALLQARGFKVRLRKLDPYLNVDPGTMSPTQHGEVFVTDDGAETDLDLGHYERFTGVSARKSDNVTTGKIYSTVIARERRGDYLGATVQVIPHITDAIKEFIRSDVTDEDFIICEVGGTVGDIESLPFLEAIRQFGNEVGPENALFLHVTLLPYIPAAGELKTKPTQHSVKELLSVGIQPAMLLCRADRADPGQRAAQDRPVLQRPARAGDRRRSTSTPSTRADHYHEEGFDDQVAGLFRPRGAEAARPSRWTGIVQRVRAPEGEVTIGVVGKYTSLIDSYKSLAEALVHGGIANNVKVKLDWIEFADLRGGGRGRATRACPRHPGARRLRRARQRGQDPRGPVRARAQGAVFRHLLRHADGGDRGGPAPGRPARAPTPPSSARPTTRWSG